MLKLGIISDTHGFLKETQRAIQLFQEHDVQAVIHCGDIGSVDIVLAFQGLETHFVFGNMDGENAELRIAAEKTGNRLHGWFGSLELSGKRIAFLHGHQTEKFEQELESGTWDLICFGHTHVALLQKRGSTILLNPGAFKQVPHPTVVIATLPDLSVEQFDI